MVITEIIIKKFDGESFFTALIFRCNHLKPTEIKINSSHHARIVLEQFTKLCSSELGGAIPSDGVSEKTREGEMKCKKCNKEFKVLAKGVCAICDPEAWAKYFKVLTGKRGQK